MWSGMEPKRTLDWNGESEYKSKEIRIQSMPLRLEMEKSVVIQQYYRRRNGSGLQLHRRCRSGIVVQFTEPAKAEDEMVLKALR